MIEDILKKLPKSLRIEIVENLQKDLTQSEKYKAQKQMQEILRKYSQQGRRTDLETSSKHLEKVAHGIEEKIGKIFNESHEKVRQRRYVFEWIAKNPKKHPGLEKRIDSGKTSLSYAYQMLKQDEYAKKPTPNLPKDEFELIYADFALKYDLPLSGSPDYKTMTLETTKKEIPKLPAYKNCVLFNWTSSSKLLEALDLIKFYGFTYKTHIIWVKTKDKKLWYDEEIADTKVQLGIGHNIRNAHELLLIAHKGTPRTPLFKPPSVVFAERTRKHSEKPKVFRKIINDCYPVKKKLEMFNRDKDEYHNKTWHYWGDESEG